MHQVEMKMDKCVHNFLGDCNCLVAPADTTANFREKYSKELETLLKAFKYHDAYRLLDPRTEEYTFHRAKG